MSRLSRKAVGPDFLVSVLLLGLIGLGGVFFLQVFVNGLAMQGIIAILDTETDQRCFYILLPLIGDDYLKGGVNVSEARYSEFRDIQSYYGGRSVWMDVSYELNQTVNYMSTALSNSNFGRNITYFRAYIATEKAGNQLRSETYNYMKSKGYTITQYCMMPVYSPVGMTGFAELFMSEALKS